VLAALRPAPPYSGEEVNALKIGFSYTNATVLTGFALGFAIALVTVVLSSVRTARLNIIRAIRDIQEPPRDRPRRRLARGGLILAILGVGYTVVGFTGLDGHGVTGKAGPTRLGSAVTSGSAPWSRSAPVLPATRWWKAGEWSAGRHQDAGVLVAALGLQQDRGDALLAEMSECRVTKLGSSDQLRQMRQFNFA
jgi:hypothetical protein